MDSYGIHELVDRCNTLAGILDLYFGYPFDTETTCHPVVEANYDIALAVRDF